MEKILKVLFLILIINFSFSCSKKTFTGTYQTNFRTYGVFNKTLIVNCDGNASLNFQGDMQNNTSFGNWIIKKDTLIIYFDPIVNKENRYKGEYKFILKKNRLENMPIPKDKYEEFIKKIKESGNDTIKIPSYRKFNKSMNLSLKNFNGKTGHQYFKKIKNLNCE